jgi:methionyl-tRNA formyltransferase
MRLVFLTVDDPLYLPDFFDRVLAARGGDTQAVYVVPPLYKDQTTLQAARRYYRTFGFTGVRGLGARVASAKLRRRSIAAVCGRHGVHAAERKDVNSSEFIEELRELSPDVIVSVSCPQIFKKPLIELPAVGTLNVHGAILPNYRGVMPSFWMLANGERQAGVSIFFVNEEIDAGDLCGQRAFDIEPSDTLDSLLRRSKAVAAALLVETLEAIETGAVDRRPLDMAAGSYHSWPSKEDVKRFEAAGRRLW